MARRAWDQLSGAYRRRLERAGVEEADYRAGGSLTAARGHGSTPERPERAARDPGRYVTYLTRPRQAAAREAQGLTPIARGDSAGGRPAGWDRREYRTLAEADKHTKNIGPAYSSIHYNPRSKRWIVYVDRTPGTRRRVA